MSRRQRGDRLWLVHPRVSHRVYAAAARLLARTVSNRRLNLAHALMLGIIFDAFYANFKAVAPISVFPSK